MLSVHACVPAAWWNWNVFSRTLAGNYSHDFIGGIWSAPSQDLTTPDLAHRLAAQAAYDPMSSTVLKRAMEALKQMPAFMLTERYDESVQLLAHTFCWHLDQIDYTPKSCQRMRGRRKDELKRKCDELGIRDMETCLQRLDPAEWQPPEPGPCSLPLLLKAGGEGPATDVVHWPEEESLHEGIATRLSLDMILYDYAEELFEERLADMRADQKAGFRCHYQWKEPARQTASQGHEPKQQCSVKCTGCPER